MFFLRKIFSPFLLFLSVILFFYIFYKAEIYWKGEKNDYYLVYYIFSGSLFIFSVITLFLNKIIKDYLIIFTISVVTGLYLFEAYLTYWIDKPKIYKQQTGLKYDTRTKIEIYKDLKKINDKVVMRVTPMNYLNNNNSLYPLSGISNSETILCNESGFFAINKSDRFGFNNPDTEWNQKEIEFLLVGDSFAHGSCVNRPDDIASVLRTISDKSVLNLGYAANGPLTEYATLREYLNPNVKKVIWIYYEFNDLLDLKKELKNKTLKNYLDNLNFSQNLKEKQNEINELANNIIFRELKKETERKRIKSSFSFNLFKFIRLYELRTSFFREQPKPQKEFIKILKQANDLVTKNNSKLYFVYLPGYFRYKMNYGDASYLEVKKIVTDLKIPFIDIHSEVFEKEKDPIKLFPFGLFGHYTSEGYKKVAKAIHKLSK